MREQDERDKITIGLDLWGIGGTGSVRWIKRGR
jgi:hypothetical protein